MSDIVARLVWFVVAASAVSYGSYIWAGSVVNARAAGVHDPILIRDVLAPGIHHISGMIMVPTPCDQLSVRKETLSATSFLLVFKTWREPSVKCEENQTPRPFSERFFAPAVGIRFSATLDGVSIPVRVLTVILPAAAHAVP